mmetsp:Transcript_33401/g.54837  ORF Transcript_33401/g.54837 Transcript_33401/m.54837 type:complete len:251 (+) Transcript_33401:1-753(+)
MLKGFGMISSAPQLRHWSRVTSSVLAVTSTTGVEGCSCFKILVASTPPITGISTSIRITSKDCSRAASIACLPFSARCTWAPNRFRNEPMINWFMDTSSTLKTDIPIDGVALFGVALHGWAVVGCGCSRSAMSGGALLGVLFGLNTISNRSLNLRCIIEVFTAKTLLTPCKEWGRSPMTTHGGPWLMLSCDTLSLGPLNSAASQSTTSQLYRRPRSVESVLNSICATSSERTACVFIPSDSQCASTRRIC